MMGLELQPGENNLCVCNGKERACKGRKGMQGDSMCKHSEIKMSY